jgi:RNA polymerase sigma-70 factor, ECF subfamily
MMATISGGTMSIRRDAHEDTAVQGGMDAAARHTVEDLYAHSGIALVGFARRLGLTEDEAWDAAQEAHVRLWRSLSAGDAIADPRAWVAAATYRLAMDQHRLARRVRDLRLRLIPRPGGPAHDATDRIAAWAAVDALPVRQRAAIYLHYRLDMPFEQVGRAMGISAGAARTSASRGLATARVALGIDEPEADR